MAEPNDRPAVAQAPISVILIAEAPSADIHGVLQSWRTYFEKLARPHEILLVEEIRPDNPVGLVGHAEASRTFPYDRVTGQGAALNEAIRSAQYPLIVFCTADRQFIPADVERLLKSIDQVDLVVGFRESNAPPYWRLLLDAVIARLARVLIGVTMEPTPCWLGWRAWRRRWIARWMFGVRVHDPECPFRVARRAIFDRIPIQSSGSFALVEMLAKVNFVPLAGAMDLPHLVAEELVPWTPPESPTIEATSFSADAWRIFRDPQFKTGTPPLAQETGAGISLT